MTHPGSFGLVWYLNKAAERQKVMRWDKCTVLLYWKEMTVSHFACLRCAVLDPAAFKGIVSYFGKCTLLLIFYFFGISAVVYFLTRFRLCLLFLTNLLSASPENRCVYWWKMIWQLTFSTIIIIVPGLFCNCVLWGFTYSEMVQARQRRPPGKQCRVAWEVPHTHSPWLASCFIT